MKERIIVCGGRASSKIGLVMHAFSLEYNQALSHQEVTKYKVSDNSGFIQQKMQGKRRVY